MYYFLSVSPDGDLEAKFVLFQIMWFLKQVCGPQSFFYEVSFTVNMGACRIMVVTISLISLVYLCSCGSMTYMCVALLIVWANLLYLKLSSVVMINACIWQGK